MLEIRKYLLIALVTVAPGIHAQQPAAGRLLVADAEMRDPDLAQTVMLLLIHENGTSAGIFLNRPTWVEPDSVFPDLAGLGFEGPLFRGGPIAPDQVLTVFEHDGTPPVGARRLFGNVYFSPTPEVWEILDVTPGSGPRVRLFAGHAQWGTGQLEQEIAAGTWHVVEGDAESVFSVDPEGLWRELPTSGRRVTAAVR